MYAIKIAVQITSRSTRSLFFYFPIKLHNFVVCGNLSIANQTICSLKSNQRSSKINQNEFLMQRTMSDDTNLVERHR